MDFDPLSFMLLTPLTKEELLFKSEKTGAIYKGKEEHTLLASGEVTAGIGKYKEVIKIAAYDPVNSRHRIPDG